MKAEDCKAQGSKGIRQWTISACSYSMIINKITPLVESSYWLESLGVSVFILQSNVPSLTEKIEVNLRFQKYSLLLSYKVQKN